MRVIGLIAFCLFLFSGIAYGQDDTASKRTTIKLKKAGKGLCFSLSNTGDTTATEEITMEEDGDAIISSGKSDTAYSFSSDTAAVKEIKEIITLQLISNIDKCCSDKAYVTDKCGYFVCMFSGTESTFSSYIPDGALKENKCDFSKVRRLITILDKEYKQYFPNG